ncbi:hypothetical protein CF392_07575 [Tamilnaduibacter salinus]|uniref:Transposase IS30-like HTH domain-containing protein n=1 Tax=Tamilnaduibacter salinus TaxID=1484056 RepID=A0A2A2I343_9GAMM|nr:hypothetical protein CF392_07575 [Tamilnaduibacter salinus]
MPRSYHHLSHVDRATIMLMHAEGHSLRAIAERLKRSPSTVSREVDVIPEQASLMMPTVLPRNGPQFSTSRCVPRHKPG